MSRNTTAIDCRSIESLVTPTPTDHGKAQSLDRPPAGHCASYAARNLSASLSHGSAFVNPGAQNIVSPLALGNRHGPDSSSGSPSPSADAPKPELAFPAGATHGDPGGATRGEPGGAASGEPPSPCDTAAPRASLAYNNAPGSAPAPRGPLAQGDPCEEQPPPRKPPVYGPACGEPPSLGGLTPRAALVRDERTQSVGREHFTGWAGGFGAGEFGAGARAVSDRPQGLPPRHPVSPLLGPSSPATPGLSPLRPLGELPSPGGATRREPPWPSIPLSPRSALVYNDPSSLPCGGLTRGSPARGAVSRDPPSLARVLQSTAAPVDDDAAFSPSKTSSRELPSPRTARTPRPEFAYQAAGILPSGGFAPDESITERAALAHNSADISLGSTLAHGELRGNGGNRGEPSSPSSSLALRPPIGAERDVEAMAGNGNGSAVGPSTAGGPSFMSMVCLVIFRH